MGDFDFIKLALGLALISFGLIGVMMAGVAFWPEQTERFKKHIPTIIIGIILVNIAANIIGFLGG